MINKKEVFHTHFPNAHYFDEENLDGLHEFLIEKGWIAQSEKVISTEKPGEGNMNFVRRVITDKRSFIIKQGRPWVEKYPDIDAPAERLEVEAKYYQTISEDPFFNSYSPELQAYDPGNLIIVFEDLGEASDFTFIYKKSQKIQKNQLNSLLHYISHLHNCNWEDQQKQFPSNQVLKQLNHVHIFSYPYSMENIFDLDAIQQGLQKLSLKIKEDALLKEIINGLGQKYLEPGPVLIHGDYYPGSWLKVDNEIKVIDPEFAYFGYAEFDIAVMTAHFFMSGMEINEIKNALHLYKARADFDYGLFSGFCGIEILRRIIGLAQLPLELNLEEKSELMNLAVEFVKSPQTHKLL